MNTQRYLLIPALVWEIFRFFVLFLINLFLFRSVLELNNKIIFWLTGLAASGLLMPAGLFFLYRYSKDKAAACELLLNILRLGKIIQFFPVFLLTFEEAVYNNVSLRSLTTFLVLLIIFVFDLIFLLLLLSYKLKPKDESTTAANGTV
jgi:hypothetical protein